MYKIESTENNTPSTPAQNRKSRAICKLPLQTPQAATRRQIQTVQSYLALLLCHLLLVSLVTKPIDVRRSGPCAPKDEIASTSEDESAFVTQPATFLAQCNDRRISQLKTARFLSRATWTNKQAKCHAAQMPETTGARDNRCCENNKEPLIDYSW